LYIKKIALKKIYYNRRRRKRKNDEKGKEKINNII
jgi:hypothetical protein